MNSYKLINDYNFGITSEIELLEKLRNKFNPNLRLSSSNYSLFDYECDNMYVELKTRRCIKNYYKSTIIGMNKVKRAYDLIRLDSNIKIYFVFRFIDSICYYEFDEQEINQLKQTMITRKDRRINGETGQYLEIPINKLIDF